MVGHLVVIPMTETLFLATLICGTDAISDFLYKKSSAVQR